MKNDLDFIKDKLENSGVNAPEGMDEGYVLSRLDGVTPDPEPAPQLTVLEPKKPRRGMITGIAAAFAAVATLSVFGVMHFAKQQPVPSGVTGKTGITAVASGIPLKSFNSYDEVRAQVKQYADSYSRYSGKSGGYDMIVEESPVNAAGSAPLDGSGSSSGSSDSSGSHSETYLQVEGVDEADVVKTDGKYLYILPYYEEDHISIYTATDAPELAATVYPASGNHPTAVPAEPDDDFYDSNLYIEEMYLHDGRLVLTCLERNEDYEYSTSAYVYDVSDISDVRLLDTFRQSGDYTSSRMVGDNLYMISEYRVYTDFEIPVCYRGAEKQEIPIDCVYSVEEPDSSNMLIVGGFSLADGSSDVQTTAVMGSVEDVYCSGESLYIYATKWHTMNRTSPYLLDWSALTGDDTVYDDAQDDAEDEFEPIRTDIFKVNLSGGISFTAYGTVEGYLDSRYSLDERNGYLRVAATVEDRLYNETNALYILDENLQLVGSVTGFAPQESIKAVRYVGDTAYVITYEQTDPLFVIDVSDPQKPAILGEVKIDGFSSMLVPIDENTVLGLGYYTEDRDGISMQVQSGFKLALFDVSDKADPKVLDEKIYRNFDSAVMEEPRALVYNPERGDYLIPLNYSDSHWDGDVYQYEVIGGALNFKVEDGKLVEIDHPELTGSGAEEYIDRCLYVDDQIYMIGFDYDNDVSIFTAQYK